MRCGLSTTGLGESLVRCGLSTTGFRRVVGEMRPVHHRL